MLCQPHAPAGEGTALVAALRATPLPRVAAVLAPVAGGRAGRGWLCAGRGRGRPRRGEALTFLQQAQLHALHPASKGAQVAGDGGQVEARSRKRCAAWTSCATAPSQQPSPEPPGTD